MKIIYGVILAMFVALCVALWGLKTAWGEARVQATRANAAESRVEAVEARFEQIDSALGDLAAETRKNQQELTAALVSLQNIQQTEEDSDETMACLDLPVPTALDLILRDAVQSDPESAD